MNRPTELRALTGLRGVAAIYVMFHHYFLGLPFHPGGDAFLAHGYLAVDLFFVLSGFVLALNYAEIFEGGFSLVRYRTFLERRLARVYPLYCVLTLLAAALVALGWLDWRSPLHPLVALLRNCFMIQVWNLGPSLDPPAWSISAEWFAYLLFPLALRLAYSSSSRMSRLAAIIAAITVVILTFLPSEVLHRVRPEALMDYHDSYRASPVIRCVPEFLLGIWITRLYLKERPLRLLQEQLRTGGVGNQHPSAELLRAHRCCCRAAFPGVDPFFGLREGSSQLLAWPWYLSSP